MDFESLVERLKESPRVDGLMFLGSTGQSTLNAFSDRDLLIVLDECNLAITNGAVYCDERPGRPGLRDAARGRGPDHSRARLDLSVRPQGKLLQLGPVRHYRPRQVRTPRITAQRTEAA